NRRLTAPDLRRRSDLEELSAESEVALVSLRAACPAHGADARQVRRKSAGHVDTRVAPRLQVWPVALGSAEQARLGSSGPQPVPENQPVHGRCLPWVELMEPRVLAFDGSAVLTKPAEVGKAKIDRLSEVVIALAGAGTGDPAAARQQLVLRLE